MILQPTDSDTYHFKPVPATAAHDINAYWQSGNTDQLSDLRSRHIGYVLQNGGLLPYLTVRDNINLSRLLLHMPLEDYADRLADKLKIAGQLEKLPAMLSVGQRQRAAIARALAHQPPVLIADEPTAAIDPINAERIVRLLVGLVEEMGVTLIVATHAHDLFKDLGFSSIAHEINMSGENSMNVSVSNGQQ